MATTHNNDIQKKAAIFRKKIIADLPVREEHINAGIPTTYLVGGEGTPLVLLHGPGESAIWWMRAIPELVKKYKVIVPDMPGHGSSGVPAHKLTKENMLEWLDEFLQKTCSAPPILIGHVVGGALALHYAAQKGHQLEQIILVDSFGLSPFRPAPMFAFEFFRFMISPSEKSYLRFLPHCMYDINKLSRNMGKHWQPFIDYNLATAKDPEKKTAAKEVMSAFSGKLPGNELEQIPVPVSLIWGRHDKANKLKIAEKASKKYGWPLHIIEDTRDDPKLEQPKAFVEAVLSSVAVPQLQQLR